MHGAGALVQAMHAIARFDPAYKSHREAGVNWMLRQVREFPNEGRTWLQNPLARNGTPKYNLAITVTANYSANALMEVHEETKDPRLLAVIDDHMAWLKQTAHQKGAKRGIDALFWTSRHELEPTRRAAKPRPLLSGNS